MNAKIKIKIKPTLKTKACARNGCKNAKKQLPLSMFIPIRGTKLTGNCLTCRESTIKHKGKNAKLIKLYNECQRKGLDFEVERIKAGLPKVPYISEKRNSNTFVDGIEHAWCCTCQDYKPVSQFTKAADRYNNLRATCMNCDKDYRNLPKVQAKLDSLVKCELCGETWKFRSMYDHMRNKHSGNQFQYKCNVCSIDLKTEKTYNKHLTSSFMHKVNTNNSTLDLKKTNQFVDNFLKNFKPADDSFTCSERTENGTPCMHEFTTADSLESHLSSSHQGEYRYFCQYAKCDKKFISHNLFDKHIKSIHTKDNTLSCPICHTNVNVAIKAVHIRSCIINLLTGFYKGSSQHERNASMFLDLNHIKYEFQKKFVDLIDKSYLSYDYYLPEYNLLLEVNGGYHYVLSGHSNSEEILERNQLHDEIKENYAKEHNYTYFAYDATKNTSFKSVATLLSKKLQLESPVLDIEKLNDYICVYLNGGKIPDFHKKKNDMIGYLSVFPSNVWDRINQYLLDNQL